MTLVKRFLVVLLAVSVTFFGVIATAPAHAHEGGSPGMREIVVQQDDHAPASHDHDEAQDAAAMAGPQGSHHSSGDTGDDAGHGEQAHVHGTPQFTSLDSQTTTPERAIVRESARLLLSAPDVSHSTFPPLRPPRASL